MSSERILQVGMRSLAKARRCYSDNNWKKAFPHFLVYLHIFPNNRDEYEEEFSSILSFLGTQLEQERQYTELFECYARGLDYFPSNSVILNNLGSHLLRIDETESALQCFEKAARSNDSILVEKNLQTCLLNLLPRWHFRMLNDRLRNEAYRTAIHNVISNEHCIILDIGAGCGLLSFYASECEFVKNIVSIESSKALASIAQRAFLHVDKIKVVCKNSMELSSSDVELANLVVTEIFDAGLFGEHALSTLIHAWENLLTPSAKIIPSCADLFVTGINSHFITAQHKLYHLKNLFVDNLCVTQNTNQPYEAENLKNIDFKIMTETKKVVNVSFSDLRQLKSLNDENKVKFSLTASESGVLHAFAVWYDLYLDDSVRITTDPREKNVTCWEQAIIYLDHPLTVVQGQKIDLWLSCRNGKLCVEFQKLLTNCAKCFQVSQDIVTFVNDCRVNEVVENFNLPDEFKSRSCRILDLNPFPLFSLRFAKSGQKGEYFFMAESKNDFEFITFLWNAQGFSSDNVTFKIFRTYETLLASVEQNSLDVIVINPLSSNGTFNEMTFNDLTSLNHMMKSDGLMLPVKVEMMVELVESEYLEFCNQVDDNNLFNFKVAEEINKYAVSEQWQIQANHFDRKTLGSAVCKFTDFNANCELITNEIGIKISAQGRANGVLCWYNLIFSDSLQINTYDSSHYKSCCFTFIKEEKEVSRSSICNIIFQQDKALIRLHFGD